MSDAPANYPWDDAHGSRPCPRLTTDALDALPDHWRALSWRQSKDDGRWALIGSTTAIIGVLRMDRRWTGVLAYDAMACRAMWLRDPPWGPAAGPYDADIDTVRISDWLQRAYRINVLPARLGELVSTVARDTPIHPVRAWLLALEGHEPWDGVERVETFAARYLGAEDTAYARIVSRVLLLSMVNRALVPGCKADCCVVLEGDQGLGKSSAIAALASPSWYASMDVKIGTKDAILAMHGKWVYELPELAGFGHAKVEAIKAFFSTSSDWVRLPYERSHKELPRDSIPIASTNDSAYLADRTGNRRYLPLLCGARGKIDHKGIARDRPQIFAEAMQCYRAGLLPYITTEEVAHFAAEETSDREQIDPWEAVIAAWLDELGPGGRRRGAAGVQMGDLLAHLEVATGAQHSGHARRAGEILRRLGYRSVRAGRSRLWVSPHAT